ncbi:MAG: glycosyltransferase family 1 protein, partial [Sphingobacteriales bacterium]
MKIGIIGTRGIPNQYGGFEQFTEFVGPALVERGHEVYVYNSSLHSYEEASWKGVHLIKKSDPEDRVGTMGQFIYDLNCILDTRKRNFDIIFQLGYTSSSIWYFLMPKRSIVVTNMDGLEWKRSKYSRTVQRFLKNAERLAATKSDFLIADSIGIQKYLYKKYSKKSEYIAYGATLFTAPDKKVLEKYDLQPYSYNLLIARMEPENNIETILEGFVESASKEKLFLIGNYNNKFGNSLKKRFECENIIFWGPFYDIDALNNLRHFSHLYFHGHSVGGTNPSLLEAMASQALIVAHDNIFNRTILEKDAYYFKTSAEIAEILQERKNKIDYMQYIQNNNEKITQLYSWTHITNKVENFLK